MTGKRRIELQKRRAARKAAILKASGESSYATKKKWLEARGLFGFQVPAPKPWKRTAP